MTTNYEDIQDLQRAIREITTKAFETLEKLNDLESRIAAIEYRLEQDDYRKSEGDE